MAKDYTNIDFSNKNSKLQFEMFPEELIQLQVEVYEHHPALLQILHNQQDKDIYMQLCEVFAYCEMIVEGTYTRDDIIELAGIALKKLMQKRTLVVIGYQ